MGNGHVKPVRRQFNKLDDLVIDVLGPGLDIFKTVNAFAYYRHGRLLGCVLLDNGEYRDPSLRVNAVAVKRAHRGKGIGSALMKRMVTELGKSNDMYLVVDARASRKSDLFRFYTRFGFYLVPEVTDQGNHVMYRQRTNNVHYHFVVLDPQSTGALFALSKCDQLASRGASVFQVSFTDSIIAILDGPGGRFCGAVARNIHGRFGIWAYPYVDRTVIVLALAEFNPSVIEGTPGIAQFYILSEIIDKTICFSDSEKWNPDSEDVVHSF
jgi:GNAT superfamily N-acetyltransferase